MKSYGNPKEKRRLRKFVDHVLLQKRVGPGIYVLRQDWERLHLNQSVISEPMNIGGKSYNHGFGTHAVSKIRVVLPEGGEKFTAEVGFDLNRYTKNAPGKIVFAVQSKGEVLWKSGPLATSDGATKVCVSLKGAEEITLEVTDDGSGIHLAHADWADARVILNNGNSLWLEELPFDNDKMTVENLPPFSFKLNGVSFREFLSGWVSECHSNRSAERVFHEMNWRNPEGNFEVRCEAIEFLNYPVLEWRLYFKNTGPEKSPVVTEVLPLDLKISGQLFHKPGGVNEPPVKLHYNRGSDCNQYDFQPITELLLSNHPVLLDCRGGRSSERHLPFWNLDCRGQGIIGSLGWSGSWKAEVYNHCDREVTMRAGMTEMELCLEPGEEISSPSVCLLFWEREEIIDSHNLFRRFMKDACIPKWEGKEPLPLAVAGNIYALEKVSEENQIEVIRKVSGCGANTYWIDAGWYQGGVDESWPSGRGNWFPDKKKFPRGLKPVSDQAHKHGFKFLVWFDPECVCPGTAIAEEHPEWVIWKNKQETGLFNLGIPAACQYLTELISSCIEESGIDVYRNDFNIDPGPFWEIADEPGRKGITEIRYVEGLYRFWDGLRKRHPHLLIDNCASGGRRIDYETCKRSVPLWRSDVQCFPDDPLFSVESQNQTYGLSFYLPVHSIGTGNFEPYNVRSVATGSIVLGVSQRVPDKPFGIPLKNLKERFTEMKAYHHLFLEDFYPLTGFSLDENSWMAYQFYDPEKGEGFALFFRRDKAPYTEAEFQLKALKPESRYTLTMVDTGKKKTGTGEKVKIVKIKLNKKSSALVLIKEVR